MTACRAVICQRVGRWRNQRSIAASIAQGVTVAAHRPDELPVLVADFVAQGADVDLDDVRIGDVVVPPDAVEERLTRKDLARMGDEQFQEIEFARGQFDRAIGAPDLAGLAIDGAVAETEPTGETELMATEHGADAGEQLLEFERLDQVVVRAGIKTGHPIVESG